MIQQFLGLPLNGDESDDGDEGCRHDADERRSVKAEVKNVAKGGTDEAEVLQEGEDAEDRPADDGGQRIDADQEHQASVQSSGNLKKKKPICFNEIGPSFIPKLWKPFNKKYHLCSVSCSVYLIFGRKDQIHFNVQASIS
jgi:hypothetical protein